jgi:hypothetical protein
MANVKITDLGAYTDPVSTDVLPIVDVGADVTKKVSIADLLKNAGSGTAAAPGIAFDGDNTGIYRPGAGQVAISIGGTEKLRITSDGKLGLQSSDPIIQLTRTGSHVVRFSAPAGGGVSIGADGSDGSTTRLRIDSSGRLLVGTSFESGGSLLQVNDDRIRIASSKTPASASDTGTAGEVCWDADYIYVAVGTNTWKRAALSTW